LEKEALGRGAQNLPTREDGEEGKEGKSPKNLEEGIGEERKKIVSALLRMGGKEKKRRGGMPGWKKKEMGFPGEKEKKERGGIICALVARKAN